MKISEKETMLTEPEHPNPPSSKPQDSSFSTLLELAANNDIDEFNRSIEQNPTSIDEIGLWYGRQKLSNQMVLKHQTPLMVASTYGSIDIIKLILSLSATDVNRTCSPDKITALHCAASGGSVNALDSIRQLLLAGADPNSIDANGRRPFDVLVVSPNLPTSKSSLEELLTTATDSPNSKSSKFHDFSGFSSPKKEYPIDPSLPDIKNSIYSTDEFRMFSFKVRPCSRAYSHDWTECPFVHPGENARRRDPRKFHYSCVPCPDFRKGSCRRGDLCEYAHGVFECWLHPAQYRTRLCKDGTSCMRRVCFFAHTADERRPLYLPSPRSSSSSAAATAAAIDMAMSLLPGSPSSPFSAPRSPSGSLQWPQPNVPTLHLPTSNRMRSSLNEEFAMLQDLDPQQIRLSSAILNHSMFGLSSPGRIVEAHSPISSRYPQQIRSLSSRGLGSGTESVVGSWGSPTGKLDWAVNGDELGKLTKFPGSATSEEPDLSWVQSLVKESQPEIKEKFANVAASSVSVSSASEAQLEAMDHTVLGAWLEQMQLDQLVA